MAKLCTDCGAPIYTNWNVCAECGAPVLDNRKISRGIPGGEKVRRLKKSVIITLIMGLVVVISQSGIGFSNQMLYFSQQDLWRDYQEGTITWEEYGEQMDELEYQNAMISRIISIIIFISVLALNLAFIFVIIGFLSISFDIVFKEKTRRLYLIITSLFILFYFYVIFLFIQP
ncbi:MAG: hypothetical protein ACFFE4_18200 [Candidatus Thorarchaeota archaeon]